MNDRRDIIDRIAGVIHSNFVMDCMDLDPSKQYLVCFSYATGCSDEDWDITSWATRSKEEMLESCEEFLRENMNCPASCKVYDLDYGGKEYFVDFCGIKLKPVELQHE